MIQVIFGKKGSGKTKRILDMANASVKEAKGNVLFIDDDKSYTLSLKPQIRFIDASEYARRCANASCRAMLPSTRIRWSHA